MEYIVDGQTYLLSPGNGIYLPKGCMRSRNAPGRNEYISFLFDTEDEVRLPVHLPSALTVAVRRLLIAFDEIAQETLNPGDERFGAFLALLLAQLRTQLRAEGEDPLVATIRRYLAEHLDQRINLADISKAVSFSPSHCQSVFRKATGRSIIDTLLDMRMKKARELISSGEFSLQDVAAMVGFEDYNYFSRQFRARSGISPSRYRSILK